MVNCDNICSGELLQCYVCFYAGDIIKHLSISVNSSFQAPFFPREAVSKGLEVWHFGLVFGAFEITVFFVSPIIGANLNRIGVKVQYYSYVYFNQKGRFRFQNMILWNSF